MTKVYARHEFIKEVHEACASGDTRRVENLIGSKIKSSGEDDVFPSKWEFQEKGDDFNLLGQSPLHIAVEKGFVEIVRLLVQRVRVDVDTADEAGWTALHWACGIRSNDTAGEISKILLDAGAEVGVVTKDRGDSALHFAAANGHLGVVMLLAGKGANVNHTNDEDCTPVHVAAQRGHTEIIRCLSAHGGDLASRNSTGEGAVLGISFRNKVSQQTAVGDI